LDLARSEEARRLSRADAVEMRIVEAGARRDLGQYDAAVLALQVPELKDERLRPWSARLFYAYADALLAASREEEAADWFARAAAADRDGETDAAERYAEIEGLEIIDTEIDDLDDSGGEAPAGGEDGTTRGGGAPSAAGEPSGGAAPSAGEAVVEGEGEAPAGAVWSRGVEAPGGATRRPADDAEADGD
jgi:hypothetical protein